jgi:K+-transporting ATPase KdpF subunit
MHFAAILYSYNYKEMNTTKTSLIAVVPTATAVGSGAAGYVIGAVISLLILLYLIYTLINPEKF